MVVMTNIKDLPSDFYCRLKMGDDSAVAVIDDSWACEANFYFTCRVN
jgi:hypothetical protein